jgi:type II secretion system (T2SS) protein E
MTVTERVPWLPLGALLRQEGLITSEQLELALIDQEQHRRRLGEILVDFGWVTGDALAHALAEQYGLDFVDLTTTEPDPDAVALLDGEVAESVQALPMSLDDDGVLLVAIADPTNVGTGDELRDLLGMPIRLGVADTGKLAGWLEQLYAEQPV